MRVDENSETINRKTSITLSRNTPVALVVGAASFLGSHLVDRLLDKGIQIIGVDDLTAGKKVNLQKATQDKNFHLVIESPDRLDLDLPRLDYLFIVPFGNWHLEKVLEIFKKTCCRSLFISSIDLYEDGTENEDLKKLKETERQIATFASENKLNARILRLGPTFGPRMPVKAKDPLSKLILQALTSDLQKSVSIEFSSRALYIADAVDLAVKTIMAGSTAQKIFDGVSPAPIKISEIKQVLMDPVWYESRHFIPSPLPPWPTPNLEKTIRFLNWHPPQRLVANLKSTLNYFKEEGEMIEPEDSIEEEKKGLLEELKPKEKPKIKTSRSLPKFSLPWSKITLLLAISLITYALIWPTVVVGWSVITFRYQLNQSIDSLKQGNLEKSLASVEQANMGLGAVKSVWETIKPFASLGLLKEEFTKGDQFLNQASLSVSWVKASALGIHSLLQGFRAVTGDISSSPQAYFSDAQVELAWAAANWSKAQALGAPVPDLASKAYAMSMLLPKLVGAEGSKNYLVLLQNNMELRPAGGLIGSFAKVSFEKGKLKKITVEDISSIDSQLKIHVDPPKEIKEDLGQKDWFLADSNWESDFPTSARQAEWFYTKETGQLVDGVIALDVSALEELLEVVGPVDLPAEKAVAYSEKGFLTKLTDGLFNKIFFLPGNNWPGIFQSISKSLAQKHISIYLSDPKLFSLIYDQNWAHPLPRQSKQNQNQDFLSLVEANLGGNKVNYYLDRSYSLETVIGKNGEVKHRLRISYTNRSPADAFPGGKYKNRMRIYLPFGAKITRALWGETDLTKDVTSFVDYGRSGFSTLLELFPKQQRVLVLDYEVPIKVEFTQGQAAYRLDIVKQPGTLKDPLKWTISYPINYQIISDKMEKIGPQEQIIQTDLALDRSFEVQFKK